jgi:hypothetical protein
MSKMSRLCNQMITLLMKTSAIGCFETRNCAWILYSWMKLSSAEMASQTQEIHVWSYDNPHATKETHFQTRFSVNIWCGITAILLIRPVVLEDRLTSQCYLHFLQKELPLRLENAPLLTRQEVWLQQEAHILILVGRWLHFWISTLQTAGLAKVFRLLGQQDMGSHEIPGVCHQVKQ